MKTVHDAVAEKITRLNPEVHDKVVDALVQKETKRRTDAILNGMEKLDELKKELRKAEKPDQTSYNADGSVASAVFSKGAADALKQTREKVEKLEKALEEALGGKLDQLYNLVK